MGAFRRYLVFYVACLTIYTLVVGIKHGWNLLPVFFGDIAEMSWAGQFNLDFLGFLSLSALWVAWRHHYSPAGLALGVLAFFGGMMFLSIYLLVVTSRVDRDFKAILLGEGRAAG